jgi:hypothetical protein
MTRLHQLCLILLGLTLLAPTSSRAEISFNRDIRPILADACFHCHGPDPGTRKAGLRFDTEAGFFDPASGPTVVKGKPEDSPLYQRLITTDPDDIMPPPDSHKELTSTQIHLIRDWISQGAPWQPHWSFIPPTRPQPPSPATPSWVRNPIDAFVLSQLEHHNLQPAPPADAFTQLRRLHLDLTGLPPAPDTIESFIQQAGTDTASPRFETAYRRHLDDLLDSPAYGEHRARYWLDAARYGDTHGLHFDNYREMFPYRDWVVSAFNRNQPFDQFTIEQIAGDLLPQPTTDQLIATGFQRCNITTNEGGTIDEENLALYAADRVQTIGWVYLGLTTNCAQCHDHKFDPISMRDYYALSAFFRNTTQGPKDGNSKDGKGPILVVPSADDAPRWNTLPTEIANLEKAAERRKQDAAPDFTHWLAQATPQDLDQDLPAKDLHVSIPLNEGSGSSISGTCGDSQPIKATGPISWHPDGKLGPAPLMKPGATFDLGSAGDFESDQPFSFGAWIKAGRNGVHGGIIARMDEKGGYRGWDLFQSDRGLSVHLIHNWPDQAIKVSTRNAVIEPGKWQHVFVTYDGSRQAKGIQIFLDGSNLPLLTNTDKLPATGSIRTTTPLRVGQRSHVQLFADGAIQDVRIYTRKISPTEIQTIHRISPLRGILAAAGEHRSPQQQQALLNHYLVTKDPAYIRIQNQLTALNKEKQTIQDRSPITHIQQEKMDGPAMTNILMRGQYDQPGEEIPAAAPAALHPLPTGAPPNRLGLAQWLTAPNNPLTPRVTVNRFWQEVFGKGLVATSEDFGIMGTAPTHPQLLDWLASEFVASGWNVKQLFRTLLTSNTYRQSSQTTPEKLEQDPANDLLSRGPRFRMDAEVIRDYALAASGTLSPIMGGPGTKPYQPDNIWDVVGLPNADTRDYKQDTGENLYRRSLYTFWKRMAHPPAMDIFNAPNRETCTVRRDRTNTPLQALATLNDVQYIEAARRMATAELQQRPPTQDHSSSISRLFTRTLCRPIQSREHTILLDSLTDLLHHFENHPQDASALLQFGDSPAPADLPSATLAAYTLLCNQLLNLDETLNK